MGGALSSDIALHLQRGNVGAVSVGGTLHHQIDTDSDIARRVGVNGALDDEVDIESDIVGAVLLSGALDGKVTLHLQRRCVRGDDVRCVIRGKDDVVSDDVVGYVSVSSALHDKVDTDSDVVGTVSVCRCGDGEYDVVGRDIVSDVCMRCALSDEDYVDSDVRRSVGVYRIRRGKDDIVDSDAGGGMGVNGALNDEYYIDSDIAGAVGVECIGHHQQRNRIQRRSFGTVSMDTVLSGEVEGDADCRGFSGVCMERIVNNEIGWTGDLDERGTGRFGPSDGCRIGDRPGLTTGIGPRCAADIIVDIEAPQQCSGLRVIAGT